MQRKAARRPHPPLLSVLVPPKSAGSLLIYLSYPVSPSDCLPARACVIAHSLTLSSLSTSISFLLSLHLYPIFCSGFINYSRLWCGPSDCSLINKSYRGHRLTPVPITCAPTPNTTQTPPSWLQMGLSQPREERLSSGREVLLGPVYPYSKHFPG